VASQQICYVFAAFESANVGVTSATINEWYYNYTYLEGLFCLFISLPIWTFFGLYLDKTLPREYGRSEKWYFLCQPTFWGCNRPQGRDVDQEEQVRRETL
jgi:ATP-binding cassette subfamily A (ABC1) protein 1